MSVDSPYASAAIICGLCCVFSFAVSLAVYGLDEAIRHLLSRRRQARSRARGKAGETLRISRRTHHLACTGGRA